MILPRLFNFSRFAVIVAGGLTVFSAGCSLSDRQQMEASLRRNEISIRRLEDQLETAHKQLRDQENELQALKHSSAESGIHTAASSRTLEASVAWGAVDRLRIHQLASGVLRTPDSGLRMNVIVQPLDREGELVKVAGELTIAVQQPGQSDLLAELALDALQSREVWTSGLVARGYQIDIPLTDSEVELSGPDSHVLVTATLDLGDDRQFKASQLIRVPPATTE